MPPTLLILGGTTEATALAGRVAQTDCRTVLSLAGRVARPARQPVAMRVGGFGGVDGLVAYLRETGTTHVVDATHPFAAGMSANAVAACAAAGVPLIALTRPPWQGVDGDRWQRVPDIAGAVDALDGPPSRVMLAIGRMHLSAFETRPQHFYLLRLVDPPATAPGVPDHHVVVSRGPFTEEGDRDLMREHAIDLVVSKNSGGSGAYAKIAAARSLDVPVVMIDRPALPPRREVGSVEAVMDWLAHTGTERGV